MERKENMTFFSLIPNLINEAGHDFIYHQAIQQAVERLGVEYCALTSKEAEVKELPDKWKRFFLRKNSIFPRLINPLLKFADFFRFFISYRTRGQRILFLESFSTADLAALTFAFLPGKNDAIWLLYRYDRKQLPLNGRAHILLSKLLKMRLGERFVALTDSELIAKSFEIELGQEMIVMPIPHAAIISAPKADKKKPLFWWPGPPREAKGLEEIRYLASLPDLSNTELVAARSSLLPNTTLIDDTLEREEYAMWMQSSDVILLPYDPLVYRCGTSGIFVEAIIAGKMPLVKEGSWLAHELRKYDLEELIVDWASPTFFHDVLDLLEDAVVGSKLAKMRDAYSNFHSLENYTEIMRNILSGER